MTFVLSMLVCSCSRFSQGVFLGCSYGAEVHASKPRGYDAMSIRSVQVYIIIHAKSGS
jgi:hypothetical protein